MPIPDTGPVSLQDIQTEFGGPSPIVMSNYYAGGAFVPSGTTGNLGPIPSSGLITFDHFRGSTAIPTLPFPTSFTVATSGGFSGYRDRNSEVLGSLVPSVVGPIGSTQNCLEILWLDSPDRVDIWFAGLLAEDVWTSFVANGVTYSAASNDIFQQIGGDSQWIFLGVPSVPWPDGLHAAVFNFPDL